MTRKCRDCEIGFIDGDLPVFVNEKSIKEDCEIAYNDDSIGVEKVLSFKRLQYNNYCPKCGIKIKWHEIQKDISKILECS